MLREAFRLAKEGRPGPVLIDLPLDVQMADIPYDPEVDAPLPIAKRALDLAKIRRATDLLLAADRPVLIMGGGGLLARACDRFVEFAEYLSLPVITTYMATGGIPSDHPLHVGHIGLQVGSPFGNKFFLESDLVMGIGCRFSDRHTGKLDVYARGRKFIHINVEPCHIGRIVPTEVAIISDAGLALDALMEEAEARTEPRQQRRKPPRPPNLVKLGIQCHIAEHLLQPVEGVGHGHEAQQEAGDHRVDLSQDWGWGHCHSGRGASGRLWGMAKPTVLCLATLLPPA